MTNPWVVFLVLFVIAVVLRRFVNGTPWAVMIRDRLASLGGGWAATIMALVLGIAMTVHGMQKYIGGADGVAKFFGSLGIPAPGLMAWVIIVVELVGGVCILAGLLPQLWAALFAIDMVVAIFTAHWSQGYSGGDNGPGYEKNLVLLALALAIAFIGSGHRLSLVDLVMPDKD